MARNQQKSRIPLKLLIDENRNQVVAAEAGKDFVDILLGFLTMPMGTIIRITKSQTTPVTGAIPSIYNLYKSVENLGNENFSTEASKSVLLNHRNPRASSCMNLKINIDDSNRDKFYECDYCHRTSDYMNVKCICRGITTVERLLAPAPKADECHGAFLKGGMFLVSDDLQVTPDSLSSLVQLLSRLGLTHMNQVTEMHVEVGPEEISNLLTRSLISKFPLTDVFLPTQGKLIKIIIPETTYLSPSHSEETDTATHACKLSLKLFLRKSTNRLLCAELSEDFVDFLFSFLTIPLGSVVELLNRNSGLECIDNLYKSVESLESDWLTIQRDMLLNAGVANSYSCRNTPLRIRVTTSSTGYLDPRVSTVDEQISSVVARRSGRFVKTPSLFLASDNLDVKALSSTPCTSFIKDFNVPLCDIEERTASVGEAEALGILKASLTSSSALLGGLKSLLKEHKQEDKQMICCKYRP